MRTPILAVMLMLTLLLLASCADSRARPRGAPYAPPSIDYQRPVTQPASPQVSPPENGPVSPAVKTSAQPTPRALPKEALFNPKSWVFQLQQTKIDELLAYHPDVLVADIDDSAFTREDIGRFHSVGTKVVSYLSIGEAAEWRAYWKPEWITDPKTRPAWLELVNPEWKSYKVKYWDPEWKKLVFADLDRIVDRGYDGVYLDIVDAYVYFAEKGEKGTDRSMVDFVKEISSRAKKKNPSFMIIPQNVPELTAFPDYMEKIDGLGKESTFWNIDEPFAVENAEYIGYLDKAVANGKFVLAIDYPLEVAHKCDFIKNAKLHGYVPYVGPRLLDKLETQPNCG